MESTYHPTKKAYINDQCICNGNQTPLQTKGPRNIGLYNNIVFFGQQDFTMLPIIYPYNKVIIAIPILLKKSPKLLLILLSANPKVNIKPIIVPIHP